jgi:signal transduction histidine kinase
LADDIVAQSTRCSKIVEDLLGFARARTVLHQTVQVNELINRCLDRARHESLFEGVRVLEEYSSSLPMTTGDPYRLEQVFINITRNAGDALRNSAPPKQLVVRTRRVKEEIRVDFTDNGPGIAEPQKVFDPFYTTRAAGEGTGLGLSVSYGIVEEHGGRITARNVAGGARFTIRLPIRQPPGAQ